MDQWTSWFSAVMSRFLGGSLISSSSLPVGASYKRRHHTTFGIRRRRWRPMNFGHCLVASALSQTSSMDYQSEPMRIGLENLLGCWATSQTIRPCIFVARHVSRNRGTEFSLMPSKRVKCQLKWIVQHDALLFSETQEQ